MNKVNTKNKAILKSTVSGLEPPELNPVKTDKTTIPRMSSMRAALRRIVPV